MTLEIKLVGKMNIYEPIIIMGMVDCLPYYYYTTPSSWRGLTIN